MRAVRSNLLLAVLSLVMTLGSLFLGDTAFAQDRKIDLLEAKAIVLDIPEVKAWHEKKRNEAKLLQGQGVPAAAGVHSARRLVKDQVFWAISLVENPSTNPTKWAVFVVRAKDGDIMVETADGKSKKLSEWQKANEAAAAKQ